MDAKEFSRFLMESLAEYRKRTGKNNPEQIYLSPGVLAFLQADKDLASSLKKTQSGFTFEGVPLEEKAGQALLFVLRP
jgi:hypothetical protein